MEGLHDNTPHGTIVIYSTLVQSHVVRVCAGLLLGGERGVLSGDEGVGISFVQLCSIYCVCCEAVETTHKISSHSLNKPLSFIHIHPTLNSLRVPPNFVAIFSSCNLV